MSDTSSWQFRLMQPNEPNVDPIQGEFFSTEALGSVVDALVRESIQNSLDATLPGKVTRMRFCLPGSSNVVAKADRDMLLSGLVEHLRARHSGLTDLPAENEPFNYITIEDYGTRGLQGDPEQFEDLDTDGKNSRNDFYYFWRNIGRSVKASSDRGRWGLGKTVFQAASRINSFYALTRRHDDGRLLLMGQSVLKIHKCKGERYAPYGYFGKHKENGFAMPMEDTATVKKFSRLFALDRLNEPGISIVVPFPDKEITAKTLIKSVISHYFYPLISGNLVVDIIAGNSKQCLDDGSINHFLQTSKWEDRKQLRNLLDLARWGLKPPAESHASLDMPEPDRAPKMSDKLFLPADLQKLRILFERGDRIAVTVKLGIPGEVKGKIDETCFSILLERDDSIGRAEEHFVRQGITIAEVSARLPRGIRCIVSVTDSILSAFLGDSENPAHTEWQRNSPKFKDKYKNRRGVSTLDFIKSAPRNIVAILSRPAQGKDENLLRNIFSLPENSIWDEHKKHVPTDDANEEGESGDSKVAVHSTANLQVIRLNGGLRLRANPKAKRLPAAVNIRLAYEVRRGDPFRRYVTFDFEVDKKPISLKVKGAEVLTMTRNLVSAALKKRDFEIRLEGFDRHRDLRVKVTEAILRKA